MKRKITVTFTPAQAEAVNYAIALLFIHFEGESLDRQTAGSLRAAGNAQAALLRAARAR